VLLFDFGSLPYAFLTSQRAWRDHGGELAVLASVRGGHSVLDVGCGPGESAFGMIERVPGLRVTGLDLSASMIRIAKIRQRFDRAGDGVVFERGNAMALPYADASFDAVTGHSFLYLVPDATRVLTEVARVLKPGAKCVFLEPAASAGSALLPRDIVKRAPREPRFVMSMALWRLVSRGYGRFDTHRFEKAFACAGLDLVECRPTLSGLGLFGVGVKRDWRRAA
jgi:SAM-dependent methyltransferase